MQATRDTLLAAQAALQARPALETRRAALLQALTEQEDDAVRREFEHCVRELAHLDALRRDYAAAFDAFVQQEAAQPTPYGDRVRIAWCELCAVREKLEQTKHAFQIGESLRLRNDQMLEAAEQISSLCCGTWLLREQYAADKSLNLLVDLLVQYETALRGAAAQNLLPLGRAHSSHSCPTEHAGARSLSTRHAKKFMKSIKKALPASQQALEAQRISLEAEAAQQEQALSALVLGGSVSSSGA